MKAIVCEMCGSHDLIKQDGVYVCQNCGTKYSVEEAKKLMIEGTVEINGTVKINTDSKVENLYQLARRAKDEGNVRNAAQYYSEILIERPNDWEAQFYSVFFEAYATSISGYKGATSNVTSALRTVFGLIHDNVAEEKRIPIYREIRNHILNLGQNFYSRALKLCLDYQNGDIGFALEQRKEMEEVAKCIFAMYVFWAVILEEEKDGLDSVVLYKACIEKGDELENHRIYTLSFSERESLKDKIREYEPNYMKTIWNDSDYDDIDEYGNPKPGYKKQGCYVATVVYGSYDCPEVWTLRRYRDYDLAETWYGRAFIHTYYAISPTIVKWFGHTEWFKKMWRGHLDRIVKDLQDRGYESTPYDDREW